MPHQTKLPEQRYMNNLMKDHLRKGAKFLSGYPDRVHFSQSYNPVTLQETPKDGSVCTRKKSYAANNSAEYYLQPVKDGLSSLWLMSKPGVRWKN